MREFQERRRIRRFLHSRYAIAVLVILCLLILKGVWSVYGKYQRSQEISARTARELADLQARKKSLSEKTAALETEQGKEREIRTRFGVAKEGEKMIVIVDDEAKANDSSSSAPKGWWAKVWDLFSW